MMIMLICLAVNRECPVQFFSMNQKSFVEPGVFLLLLEAQINCSYFVLNFGRFSELLGYSMNEKVKTTIN